MCTTIVVDSPRPWSDDTEALGHYELTTILLIDHDPHEFTMAFINRPFLVDHGPHQLTMTIVGFWHCFWRTIVTLLWSW